jgi:protein-L-isoaspartate(D-aspartate) O-methyltransferase
MSPRERRGPASGREESLRREMVDRFVAPRGVDDRRVLDAMREVPRHLFVPEPLRARAYGDHSLPIGFGQTISQPYVVGVMTQRLGVESAHKVLEIGRIGAMQMIRRGWPVTSALSASTTRPARGAGLSAYNVSVKA